MNTPYANPATPLTDLDVKAWEHYEDANTAAKAEYIRHPIAKPSIPGHHYCLCCDTLTEQDSNICLCCQERSTEWYDLAHDPAALEALRHANRNTPARLRAAIS